MKNLFIFLSLISSVSAFAQEYKARAMGPSEISYLKDVSSKEGFLLSIGNKKSLDLQIVTRNWRGKETYIRPVNFVSADGKSRVHSYFFLPAKVLNSKNVPYLSIRKNRGSHFVYPIISTEAYIKEISENPFKETFSAEENIRNYASLKSQVLKCGIQDHPFHFNNFTCLSQEMLDLEDYALLYDGTNDYLHLDLE